MRTFVLFVILAGCGGGQTRPETPPETPADAAPPPAAADAVAPAPSGPVACRRQGATCTEYRDVPAERAAELRDQCGKSGGEALDACPTEKLAATCTVNKAPMTVVSSLYRGNDRNKTRGVIANARRSCQANGGTFNLAKR
jgi:hypothetical protein